MINLGVLGSTNGTDLQAVINAIESKIIDASVKIVISNKENAFILKRAKNHNINAKYIAHKNKTRSDFDQEVTNQLKENDVELILLIGFMRILSDEFCHHWQDKILNVHPSLLPKYAVPDGYPDKPVKGNQIDVSNVKNKDILYHASVELESEKLIQMGSRAVAIVGHGESIWEAEQIAEENISKVQGPLFHRKDIGTTELIQKKINHMISIK